MSSAPLQDRARVGVSACLLGQPVRYDGGHKEHPLLRAGLAPWLTLVPVCPEEELGLGTPREPIQLTLAGEAIALRAPASGLDHTEAMARFARARVENLVKQGLDGYVFKSRSPSCGLAVEVQGPEGPLPRLARGRFAEALALELPELPLCEEGDLDHEPTREAFLLRVRCHAWLRNPAPPDLAALRAFHEGLRADLDPPTHERLRGLLSEALGPELLARYRSELLRALVGCQPS